MSRLPCGAYGNLDEQDGTAPNHALGEGGRAAGLRKESEAAEQKVEAVQAYGAHGGQTSAGTP